MAYITKEEVQAKRAKLKEINKKYGVKATFSGAGSSTLKLTITAGKIDFISNAANVLKESTQATAPSCRLSQLWVLFGKERVIEGMINSECINVNQYYLSERFSGVANYPVFNSPVLPIIRYCQLSRVQLSGIQLSGIQLSGIQLSGIQLSGIHLSTCEKSML